MTQTKAENVVENPERSITLDNPLPRGDAFITSVTLRRPNSGELRGVNLMDLGQMNVLALQTVLPRISTPTLTAQDVAKLDPADLVELGAEVASFLLKKADRAAFLRE